MEERLKQQIAFILEMDKMKNIKRQTYLSDGRRKENDAEHSWHLAVMAMLLSEYANDEVNLNKVLTMVLIHDVVEIDAQDTYAYDEAGNATKKEREEKAANRIFALLPDDQCKMMRGLWDEFEEAKTPEAKFAHVLDNMQPVLLNNASGGKSWREHEVKKCQVMKRQSKNQEGAAVLSRYVQEIIRKNVENGNINDE